jgi:mono/diheme cytochrome c family protein
MNWKRIIFGGLGALLLGAAFGTPAVAADGAELFAEYKCAMCHSVASAEIQATVKSEKMKGPDLDSSVAKIDAAELDKFLKKQGQLNGQDHMKEFKGTDDDLAKIIAWLSTQAPAE